MDQNEPLQANMGQNGPLRSTLFVRMLESSSEKVILTKFFDNHIEAVLMRTLSGSIATTPYFGHFLRGSSSQG